MASKQYGIVIDAGSSGSRVHVYEWDDPNVLRESENSTPALLRSVPEIRQDPSWTKKISPGLSSFEHKPGKAFKEHIKSLLEFAEDIIPENKRKETPVFIQGTAGLRLIPEDKRTKILHEICNGITKHTDFLLEDCDYQVQVIDGETEGLYGWLSLNYLLGKFNEYEVNANSHFTFGFMDMGGASTQIAFVPSSADDIAKHKEDIATVYLKNVNGDVQEWNVFVSTWLGFGANQARNRYFAQLVNALPENTNKYDDDDFTTRKLTDPCTPKGAKIKFEFKDKEFQILGSGNYEQCSKSIYPLLLKNIPCSDEPCLFNGIHAPHIDFKKDRFIGTSEYWYTANDVFKLGGEYNFQEFNEQVIKFCNSDWQTLKNKSDNGAFNGMPQNLLKDACFKANWVLNILHEGFELPRLGFEKELSQEIEEETPIFQSLERINERELSWTLGRILLYATSTITAGSKSITAGVLPSSLEMEKLGKTFSPGGLIGNSSFYHSKSSHFLRSIFLFLMVIVLLYAFVFKNKLRRLINSSKILEYNSEFISSVKSLFRGAPAFEDKLSQLEEGLPNGRAFREQFEMNPSPSYSRTGSSSRRLEREIYKTGKSPSSSHLSSPSVPGTATRTAFSISDFGKFKDERFTE